MFRCNLPPTPLAEWPGSFTCHCGSTGMERTPNKSQHRKLTPEKKILPPLLPGFELATFRSEPGALTNKLSRLPPITVQHAINCWATLCHTSEKVVLVAGWASRTFYQLAEPIFTFHTDKASSFNLIKQTVPDDLKYRPSESNQT